MCQPQIPPAPPVQPARPTMWQIIRQLQTDPIRIMREYAVFVVGPTTDQPPGRYWLYFNVDIANSYIFIADTNGGRDGWIPKQGYSSPMQTPGSQVRTQALDLIEPAPHECFWVTPTQTGCSVLILDWGGNKITMTHLQPHDDVMFNWFTQKVIFSIEYFRLWYKNLWLRFDLAESTKNTSTHHIPFLPRKYILIQSEFFGSRALNTQVIGIKENSSPIKFYIQQYDRFRLPPTNLTVRRLEWSTYHEYLPYRGY